MKVPDKIYVKEFDEGISQMWSGIRATETSAIAQHEYIRKGALMEWLDAKAHIVGPYERQKAFNEVIDKLNTM